LPDAADRIVAKKPRAKRGGWLRALRPKSKRTVAAAALAAMMVGIVVNAVALQHGRRLEFAAVPTATAAVAVKPPAVGAAPPKVATPAPTPQPAPTTVALARAPKGADPITDFLRAQGADKRRLTLAAQGALARLGFAVRATGALDSTTRNALIEFEKSRRMPVSTEITARLVKSLTAAAAR